MVVLTWLTALILIVKATHLETQIDQIKTVFLNILVRGKWSEYTSSTDALHPPVLDNVIEPLLKIILFMSPVVVNGLGAQSHRQKVEKWWKMD